MLWVLLAGSVSVEEARVIDRAKQLLIHRCCAAHHHWDRHLYSRCGSLRGLWRWLPGQAAARTLGSSMPGGSDGFGDDGDGLFNLGWCGVAPQAQAQGGFGFHRCAT